jgi:hypothetical protein
MKLYIKKKQFIRVRLNGKSLVLEATSFMKKRVHTFSLKH